MIEIIKNPICFKCDKDMYSNEFGYYHCSNCDLSLFNVSIKLCPSCFKRCYAYPVTRSYKSYNRRLFNCWYFCEDSTCLSYRVIEKSDHYMIHSSHFEAVYFDYNSTFIKIGRKIIIDNKLSDFLISIVDYHERNKN